MQHARGRKPLARTVVVECLTVALMHLQAAAMALQPDHCPHCADAVTHMRRVALHLQSAARNVQPLTLVTAGDGTQYCLPATGTENS